jgi:hypothetical protein
MSTKTKNYIDGSDFWVDSENLSFPELEQQSFIPSKWSRYDLLEEKYKNLIIKPVNKYVSSLYPKPQLVSIINNVVRIRQKTHAEIWVKPRQDGSLYALDKCHQRQFYPSHLSIKNNECYDATYRFYIPWFINRPTSILILNCGTPDSPFSIIEQVIDFVPPVVDPEYFDTPFVHFNIKKSGEYIKDSRYGIIDIGTSMYDLEFKVSSDDIKKIEMELKSE